MKFQEPLIGGCFVLVLLSRRKIQHFFHFLKIKMNLHHFSPFFSQSTLSDCFHRVKTYRTVEPNGTLLTLLVCCQTAPKRTLYTAVNQGESVQLAIPPSTRSSVVLILGQQPSCLAPGGPQKHHRSACLGNCPPQHRPLGYNGKTRSTSIHLTSTISGWNRPLCLPSSWPPIWLVAPCQAHLLTHRQK